METFNLTIKFDTEEERDLALDRLAQYCSDDMWFIYKRKSILGWFYSENDGQHFSDAERQVI